ncbi:YqeG family HAD IIIA-type phosphatase [Candidatus Saccharibacteria bacterium]|nr:YqeG family HAD IIIA-type phosphatase [Candidatus Saccharibacteria bacterium]
MVRTNNSMRRTHQTSILYPDYIATSVLEIRPAELKKAGITHLVLDIDETIVPKRHNELANHYISFLEDLEKMGFVLLIGSNTNRDVTNIIKHFNAQVVKPTTLSFKPLRRYYKRVIAAAGTDAKHIAMVGDKILNDIIGGNNAGLLTIMVEPYARQQKIHHRFYFRYALRNTTSN